MTFRQLGGVELADRRFECPRCGARSTHPEDIANRYCGRCHAFTGSIQETWVDTLSCGHEQRIVVVVPPDHAPLIGESVVCMQCRILVVRMRSRRW